jgi:hypothetical protein
VYTIDTIVKPKPNPDVQNPFSATLAVPSPAVPSPAVPSPAVPIPTVPIPAVPSPVIPNPKPIPSVRYQLEDDYKTLYEFVRSQNIQMNKGSRVTKPSYDTLLETIHDWANKGNHTIVLLPRKHSVQIRVDGKMLDIHLPEGKTKEDFLAYVMAYSNQ